MFPGAVWPKQGALMLVVMADTEVTTSFSAVNLSALSISLFEFQYADVADDLDTTGRGDGLA